MEAAQGMLCHRETRHRWCRGGGRTQDQQDLALRGLVLLAQFHGIAADASQLAHDAGLGNDLMDETTLVLAARKLGYKARMVSTPCARLALANVAALALVEDGDAFIIARISGDQVLIHDLVQKRPQNIDMAALGRRYRGRPWLAMDGLRPLGR